MKLSHMGVTCRHEVAQNSRGPISLVLAILALLMMAAPSPAVNDVAGPLITFNDNGGWSWFEDERAVVDTIAGKIVVSSVANAAGVDGGTRIGDVEIASLNLATGAINRSTLADSLQADDHDSAAIWIRPDGRYLTSYSKHSSDPTIHFRISTNPRDISAWNTEQTLTVPANTAYSNLYYLPNDNGGNGRLYDFSRNLNFDPNVAVSYDNGDTWSYGGKLLTEGGSSDRPYVRYASDGQRIQLTTTNRHPRNYDNNVYAGYVQDGALYNSFGTVVDGNVLDSNGQPPASLTPVFVTGTQFGGVPMHRAWTIDEAIDSAGMPYVIFQARANDSDTDHRFFYARFNGSAWNIYQLAKAGGYLYSSENDYTGLAALDPSNPNRLFISTKIDPRTNINMPRYEIFEGVTNNGGANWDWQPITYNSTMDNLRPIVPKWDTDHTALMWLRGNYSSYTNYNLQVVGLTDFKPITGGGTITAPPVLLPAVGPWKNAIGFGNGPITNSTTSSPTVGDGSSNSATQQMIYSAFPTVTLAHSGDKIVFTGSVTLSGTVNSPASSGAPRTQFRFGLFDGDNVGPDDNGWVGYYMSNRHGDPGSPAGVLALKPSGNTSAYLSTAGQTVLASAGGDGTGASLFHDDTYAMSLTIERSGDDLVISAALAGANGFVQSLSAMDQSASTAGTYAFDRLGFLLGNNLQADKAEFSNLLVTFIAAAIPGDFNGDNKVDAADYVVWRKAINTPAAYNAWREFRRDRWQRFGPGKRRQRARTGGATHARDPSRDRQRTASTIRRARRIITACNASRDIRPFLRSFSAHGLCAAIWRRTMQCRRPSWNIKAARSPRPCTTWVRRGSRESRAIAKRTAKHCLPRSRSGRETPSAIWAAATASIR